MLIMLITDWQTGQIEYASKHIMSDTVYINENSEKKSRLKKIATK